MFLKLSKILLYILSATLLSISIFLCALYFGYLNPYLPFAIEKLSKSYGLDSEVDETSFDRGELRIKSVDFKNSEIFGGSAQDLRIKASFRGYFFLELSIGKCLFKLKNQDAEDSLEAQIFANAKLKPSGKISRASLSLVSLGENADPPEADLYYSDEKGLHLKGNIKSVPLDFFKIFGLAVKGNKAYDFLNESLSGGYLKYGNFEIKFSDSFFKSREEFIKGSFSVEGAEFKYDPDLPPLTKVSAKAYFSDKDFGIEVKRAYVGDFVIKDALVTIEGMGKEESSVKAVGGGSGPVKDLIGFVPAEYLKKLAERGIDLRNIKGSASADIKLEIPLDPEKENIFDISAKTEKIKLEAFGGKLSLKEARVKGLFDGKKVSVGIDGKINGFSSIINYEYNFSEKAEQEHYLKASTKIKGDGTNFGFVRLDSGKAALDFEYKKNRAGQENFTAISDLKGLEFYLVKIGIRKIIGQKANLSVSGILDEKGNGKTDLLLTGDDKLQIKSSIKIEGDSVLYSLPRITFENTDLKAEITENKDDFKIKISGPSWDLSSSEMKDFISKGSEDKAMELSLDAGKIFLKNGVYLNDVRFSLKCAKNRCEKGYLDAKLGSKLLKLILTPREGYEQWVISTGNAGALLRALGIYQNMKAGTLMAVLETRREETPVGAIVPVTDGKFSIKKFTLSNAPFLTRIVSFVSMPGFVSFLTNNKNVNFLQMEGAFSYSSDRVKIIKSSAEGPFFDFTMRGDIDTEKRLVKLKGDVVPSLYGISSLIRSVPVLGKLFGGKKSLIRAPYSLEQKY